MPMKCETNILQDLAEFNEFLTLIKQHNVSSYLEIGSKHGGSLWRIANALPKGSRIVSVDLPHADGSFKQSRPNLLQCGDALKKRGYDVHLFLTDSTDPNTIAKVKKLAPFDLCLIDACHLEPYIRQDFANYGPLAKIVAFHDVNDSLARPPGRNPIDVKRVWQDIKRDYKHIEIIKGTNMNGIGVLWR
jgi:cephalosporin hydroxylase